MAILPLFRRFILAIAVVSALIMLPGPEPTVAAGPWYVAMSGSDTNDCQSKVSPCSTINEAIAKADPGGTIYVAEGVYTNTGAAVVRINKDITLSGGWNVYFSAQKGRTILDGQSARRGITIAKNVKVSIEKLEITHGLGDSKGGGGILIDNKATVHLADSLIQETQSDGAIDAANANLTLVRTTIRNSVDRGIQHNLGTLRMESSAVINSALGISSSGEVVIENSTISGNTLGGIAMECAGAIRISGSTITKNGEFGLRTYSCNQAVLQSTILAGNTNTTNPDCSGQFTSNGYNIIGSTDGCDFTPTTGDLVNTNPVLGPLKDNGGPTLTHALLPGSPAIDAGDPDGCVESSDQRGASRLDVCDIGAYEAGGTLVSLSASSNPSTFGQPVTLTAQVVEGEAGAPKGTVNFTYEGGPLGSVPLDGTGKATLTVSTLSLGNHTVIANYSGDANFSPSASPDLVLKVGYSTVISITAAKPDPSVVGQPISVSFRVTSSNGKPAGMVMVLGDVGSKGCSAALANGQGSCQIIITETGPVNLTATYLGEGNYNTSQTTEPHLVNKAETTVTITADTPDPSDRGQPVTVEFTLAVVAPGAGTPTGPVTVTASGGLESCTGTLTNGSGSCQITLNNSGLRTLTASYEGDDHFNSSVSESRPHTVGPFIGYLPIAFTPCKPLYNDDFSNPGSGWPVTDDGKILTEYTGGEYRILLRAAQLGAITGPYFKASDYIVTVDLRNPNAAQGSYGIAFGIADDWSTYYSLEIYADGWYGIYRSDPSGYTTLSEDHSPAIKLGSAANQIKVERIGASIKAYANDQLLASVTDSTYTGSRYIGVVAFSYDQPNLDVRFDNFKVSAISCGGSTPSGLDLQPDLHPGAIITFPGLLERHPGRAQGGAGK